MFKLRYLHKIYVTLIRITLPISSFSLPGMVIHYWNQFSTLMNTKTNYHCNLKWLQISKLFTTIKGFYTTVIMINVWKMSYFKRHINLCGVLIMFFNFLFRLNIFVINWLHIKCVVVRYICFCWLNIYLRRTVLHILKLAKRVNN